MRKTIVYNRRGGSGTSSEDLSVLKEYIDNADNNLQEQITSNDDDIQDINDDIQDITVMIDDLQNKDTDLQEQIDTLVLMQNYDYIALSYAEMLALEPVDNGTCIVTVDETHEGLTSVYRFTNNIWVYHGSTSSTYTKSEIDTMINTLQEQLNVLQQHVEDDTIHVTQDDKDLWNSYPITLNHYDMVQVDGRDFPASTISLDLNELTKAGFYNLGTAGVVNNILSEVSYVKVFERDNGDGVLQEITYVISGRTFSRILKSGVWTTFETTRNNINLDVDNTTLFANGNYRVQMSDGTQKSVNFGTTFPFKSDVEEEQAEQNDRLTALENNIVDTSPFYRKDGLNDPENKVERLDFTGGFKIKCSNNNLFTISNENNDWGFQLNVQPRIYANGKTYFRGGSYPNEKVKYAGTPLLDNKVLDDLDDNDFVSKKILVDNLPSEEYIVQNKKIDDEYDNLIVGTTFATREQRSLINDRYTGYNDGGIEMSVYNKDGTNVATIGADNNIPYYRDSSGLKQEIQLVNKLQKPIWGIAVPSSLYDDDFSNVENNHESMLYSTKQGTLNNDVINKFGVNTLVGLKVARNTNSDPEVLADDYGTISIDVSSGRAFVTSRSTGVLPNTSTREIQYVDNKGFNLFKLNAQSIPNNTTREFSTTDVIKQNMSSIVEGTVLQFPKENIYTQYRLTLRLNFEFVGNPTANGTYTFQLHDFDRGRVITSKTFGARQQSVNKDEISFNMFTLNKDDVKSQQGIKFKIVNNSGVAMNVADTDIMLERL